MRRSGPSRFGIRRIVTSLSQRVEEIGPSSIVIRTGWWRRRRRWCMVLHIGGIRTGDTRDRTCTSTNTWISIGWRNDHPNKYRYRYTSRLLFTGCRSWIGWRRRIGARVSRKCDCTLERWAGCSPSPSWVLGTSSHSRSLICDVRKVKLHLVNFTRTHTYSETYSNKCKMEKCKARHKSQYNNDQCHKGQRQNSQSNKSQD